MKFIVNSNYLLKQLSSISGALTSNPVVPILSNFLFEIDGGNLTVTASDLQISMTSVIKVESKEQGSVAIPARILLETLKNLPDQPITFSVIESTYGVEINSDNGKYKLSGENAADFPKTPSTPNDFSIALDSVVLLKAINSTVFAVSSDELRPEMQGVHVEFEKQDITFVATDGHRMVRYVRKDASSDRSNAVIIPRKALQLLKNTLPQEKTEVTLGCSVSSAFFGFGNVSMICRLIDERFPDYRNVIPQGSPIKVLLDRAALVGLLRRISIYANQATRQVKLTIKGNELQASAEDLDFSNAATERMACEHDGDDIEIGFNARLLIDMLANLDSDRVEIGLSTPNRSSVILPAEQEEGEDVLMLVVPIMLHQQ